MAAVWPAAWAGVFAVGVHQQGGVKAWAWGSGDDDQWHRGVTGQADRGRADDPVGGVGGAADHDRHGVAGAGVAEGGGRREQFFGDDALAPLESPGRRGAVQLPGGGGAQLLLDPSKSDSSSAMAPGDSMARLDRCATYTTSMRPVRPCSKRTAASSARLAGGEPSYPTIRCTDPAGGVAVVTVVHINSRAAAAPADSVRG